MTFSAILHFVSAVLIVFAGAWAPQVIYTGISI